jgi:hypothetical protein
VIIRCVGSTPRILVEITLPAFDDLQRLVVSYSIVMVGDPTPSKWMNFPGIVTVLHQVYESAGIRMMPPSGEESIAA